MVDPILSSFLLVLIERVLPLVLAELKKLDHDHDLDLDKEVNEILRHLSVINGFVENVERRGEVSSSHKTWLDHVQDAVYKTNDLLDEITTEMLRIRHIEFLPVLREKLSIVRISRRADFKCDALRRLRDVKKYLNEIINESRTVSSVGSGSTSPRRAERLQTTCFLHGPVFGRNEDVKFILGWMFEKYSPASFNVLCIQGMAGVGKTTLAKMVFNDENLANRFHVKKWVHAPQDSTTDVTKLLKSMMESFTGNICQLLDLNNMQERLRRFLDNKKYLLVLDELSIESDDYWQNLKSILSVGAAGSKVLITTCKRSVAYLVDALGPDALPYQLGALSEDDSLRLFNTHAICKGVNNAEADPSLNEIRRRILEKCKGLPCALAAFGKSDSTAKGEQHHHQNGIDRWKRIADKEAGEVIGLNNEIFRAMSSTMKRCFAYCSTFPPGFQFKKEMLVQLCMAQNFVQKEDTCGEFFDNMFNWFLFEYLDYDYRKTHQTYVMHDCIHSIAKLMSDGECCMVVDQGNKLSSTICLRTRHASIVVDPNNTLSAVDFSPVYVAKGLYSLLLISHQNIMDKVNLRVVPDDLATKLPRLRSLDLSHTHIEELPDSIGDLKHLRYLALQNTSIKKLPNSMRKLYNLQTLGLANCYELATLPSGLKSLQNLMYLDLQLDDDSKPSALRCMPPHMSKLEGLITLSRFVSSYKDHCGVSELRTLTKLRDLCISNLHSVVDARQAQEANLANKDHLRVLELQWGLHRRNIPVGVQTNIVLEHLRPHHNLKELRIKGYAGYSFPEWMTAPSFSFLATLKLIDCKECNHLPPLGHLPALQKLFIKGMDGIKTIDCRFCGQGANTSFKSLTEMHLEGMPNLQTWIGNGHTCNFPVLRELTIRDCNNLTQISHSLQSLTNLEIIRCSKLHDLRSFPSLSSLDVRESGAWIWASISLRCLPSLSSMTLAHLPMMDPVLAMQPLTTIRRLEIIRCFTPEYLPDNWLPNRLTYLLIKHCPNLRALPGGLHKVETLQVLKVQDCEKLEFLGERMGELMSLQSIHLSNCPMVSNLASYGLPLRLQKSLTVDRCPNLSRWIQFHRRKVVQAPTVLIDGAPLW